MIVNEDIQGTYHIPDLEEMRSLAGKVADAVEAGDILLLKGEVGTGKTTFTRSLATALQVTDQVTSPTFTIAAEYDVPSSHILNQLVHIDLYRLEGKGDISSHPEDWAHMQDMFSTARQTKRLIVVEWADRLGAHVPKEAWVLQFAHGKEENERVVTITKKVNH